MTILRAELDPYAGAQVRAKLDGLSGKTDEADKRSFPQRQADALVLLASRADELAEELPGVGKITSDVLLITTRCSGLRRNRPAALQGTRLRAGRVGTLSSPWAGPGRRLRPPQAPARASQGQTRQACAARAGRGCWRSGVRPRGQRRGATRVCTRGLGRARGPGLRGDTPHCWNCHNHIHNHGWQITRDATGRYRAGPPGDPDHDPAPHLDNSIENRRQLVHTG